MSTQNSATAPHDLVSMATELSKFAHQLNGHAAQVHMCSTLPDLYVQEQINAALKSMGEVMTREAVYLTEQLPELSKTDFWGSTEEDRRYNAASITEALNHHLTFTRTVFAQLQMPQENALTVALDNAINATQQQMKVF